jgi:addiction module HigA family antidote
MTYEILAPVHPGEVLREEYLEPLDITPYRLAAELGMSRPAVNDLCRGKSSVSPRMAAMLGRYFGTSAGFWMNLQMQYDVRMAAEDPDIAQALAAIRPHPAAVQQVG